MKYIKFVLALLCISFHIYLIYASFMPNLLTRAIHLSFAIIWVFLFMQSKSKFEKNIGYLFLIVGLFSSVYIAYFNSELSDQYGSLESNLQYFIAFSLILTVLEMARRAIKLALPLTALFILCYGFFGHYFSGNLGHQEIPLDSFLGTLSITEGGIFGQLTGVSATVVAIFVILGAFIGGGEGANAFMKISTGLAGRLGGGAAKVSILASAFFGSISGSASANVASTGAFTIPNMKKLGYKPSFAASVEAVSSTGGQIMPPLMGAGAFIMADLLGINYSTIVIAAFFPALLFFFCVWVGVSVFAKRYSLKPMQKDEIPTLKEILKLSPFFLLPFGALLILMLGMNKTPQYSAGVAIFISILLLFFDKNWKFSLKEFWSKFQSSCINAFEQIATIASIIICAGIIIGVLNITGIGVKLTSMILYLSNGNLYITLILTAVACLILGMEVPTTAAYVICASICVPILSELGLNDLTSNLFIFWFSLLSTITPPVCGGVFIASAIAGANWLEVSKTSMKLGVGLYIIPLSFISNENIINLQNELFLAFLAFAKIALGLWLLSNALINSKLSTLQKTALFIVALLIIFL